MARRFGATLRRKNRVAGLYSGAMAARQRVPRAVQQGLALCHGGGSGLRLQLIYEGLGKAKSSPSMLALLEGWLGTKCGFSSAAESVKPLAKKERLLSYLTLSVIFQDYRLVSRVRIQCQTQNAISKPLC